MSLKRNTRLIGQHAFLSPSSYHWLDYDEDKLRRVYFQRQQALRGDRLHSFAQQAIELGVIQAENGTTLSMYINDAIRYRMTAEVPLYFSDDCFGTADSVGCRDKRHTLAISKPGCKYFAWFNIRNRQNYLRLLPRQMGCFKMYCR